MSGCLMAGATALALAGNAFSLEWTHSIEKTIWHEDWSIREGALVLTGAAVKGSGAGMEPGPGAQLRDGWWVWTPDLPPQPQLLIASSGATGGAWHLCEPAAPGAAKHGCVDLGGTPGQPIELRPCP